MRKPEVYITECLLSAFGFPLAFACEHARHNPLLLHGAEYCPRDPFQTSKIFGTREDRHLESYLTNKTTNINGKKLASLQPSVRALKWQISLWFNIT